MQHYLFAGKTTKIINYLITMIIYLLFDRLLTILHFPQNGFIFVCVSLILWSQSNNKNFGVKILTIQSVFDWDQVYKTNYLCTIETKLRSFQIKLNLRVIVTNIQLFGFGLIESQIVSFATKHPKP